MSSRVFFDSRTFLAGLLCHQAPHRDLFMMPTDRFTLVLSDAMFTEVLDVLRRSTTFMRALPDGSQISLKDIFAHMQGEIPNLPDSMALTVCQDPHDNKFLSSAIYLECDYLVTEVPDLLGLESKDKWREFREKNGVPVKILDVASFVALFRA